MIYLNNMEKTIHKPAETKLTPVSPEEVKALLAALFTVKNPDNIFLTQSGSQAMELALLAFAGENAHIVTTRFEQEDTYEKLQELKGEVTYLKSDVRGQLSYEEADSILGMEERDAKGSRVLVCAHGCSATGNVTDLERICARARSRHIPVIADGRLTAGAIDVNLEAIGADVYVITGEKMLMGPAGIGAVIVKDGTDTAALKRLMEARETEPSQLAVNVFAASLAFILDRGIYGVAMLPHRLAKRFYESSKAMDPIIVHGDYGPGDRLPVVAISAEGFTAEEIQRYMAEQGIAIGVEKGLARFSFGYCNTRPQVKETVQRLMDMLGIDDSYLLP